MELPTLDIVYTMIAYLLVFGPFLNHNGTDFAQALAVVYAR
jgi:hypothetical protein